MIDPHVHLRDWNQKEKETISHGLSVAKLCSINYLFDMPNTNPPLISRENIICRLTQGTAEAAKIGSKYAVYAGLTNDEDQIKEMYMAYNELFPNVVGLKMFLSNSTGNMGIVDIDDQRRVVKTLVRLGFKGVLAVHAEKESLNNSQLENKEDFRSHSYARPAISEIESVKDIIRIVKDEGFKGHLHICHISVREAVEEVVKAKDEGLSISMGATAHHALLSIEDAKEKDRFLKMNPPLRTKDDQMFIYNALKKGIIDNVESDHAPHTRDDKLNGASGIPGFAGTLLLYHRLKEDGLDEESLENLFGRNVLKIFSLKDEKIELPVYSKELFDKINNSYEVRSFRA